MWTAHGKDLFFALNGLVGRYGCVAGIVQILQELDEELTCRFVSE